MARYFNLPRIELTTLDGQLVAIIDRPLTDSVLIIGPAVDGPVERPVRVNNVGDIESVFGPVTYSGQYPGPNGETGATETTSNYNGNALVKALREVQSGGAADIRLWRVGGTKSLKTNIVTGFTAITSGFTGVLFSSEASLNDGTFTATAKNGGRIYNQVSVTFSSGAVSGQCTLTQPTVKGGSVEFKYSGLTSGTTVLQLFNRINSDPRNRTVNLSLGTLPSSSLARNLRGTFTLAGGTDGTIRDDLIASKIPLYTAFTEASTGMFALMEDTEVDVIYLYGIYVDDQVDSVDTTKSIAKDFADYLGSRTVDHPIIGVLGVRPLDDFSSRAAINTHFAALTTTANGNRNTNWLNAGYFMYSGFPYNDGQLEQPIDAGGYLQIVAADAIFNDADLKLYTDSVAGIYAGTVAALKPHMPTTHKVVNGIFGLPYEFTRSQLDQLVGGVGRDVNSDVPGGGAYVTVRRIEGRGILFTRDVTASLRNSDFKDLQPLRIANAAHKGIKNIAFTFLGQPNDIAHRQALETAVKTFLDGMFEAGALLGKDGVGYSVQIRGGDTPLSNLLGILEVDVMLRPALQIKVIQVRVRLSL